MDAKNEGTAEEICSNKEISLPEVTASLEMLTVTPDVNQKVVTKRVFRKRIPRTDMSVTANRRCSQKPRKRRYSEMEGDADITGYYLDKNLQLSPKKLETILEERTGPGESSVLIGAKKFKRMIEFQVEPTASKLKKRRARVKKVFGSNIKHRRRCTTMEVLFAKLNTMQPESSPEFEGEDK
ncbi:uncharacterized protein [Neodiprion pinetum]|uniref:Uncharacterized protein LOC107221186 isoform X1 n=2 Tax=Neodiprion lecontei TaxID=441921 RepID=A0A6J0BMV6_NEOLC|nr:uncharacterized protein LOC107221186 isoform X1 [Neodiprion lecontei]XP_046428149.1 uncharacterized protein LOC124183555 [Neodiprion fabricii]XP_046484151.1 uncharacterized protein LOC124219934 [Neodiprion pinetum]XP_046484152.1 uncharacterized protein LOC124219934 [Neodiprion pinetum]